MRQKGINHDTKDENIRPLEDLKNLKDTDKQEIGQALQMQHEIENDITNEVEEDLRVEFDQTRNVMKINIELRKKLIGQVRTARQ